MDDEKEDNFSWARELGFPPSGCTDSNLLNKGLIGLLWNDASKLLDHPKNVMEARKNILLYKLKNNSEDPCIDFIRNTDQLKTDREHLNDRIKTLEEKYKSQELTTIEKENELRLIKHNKKSHELKKECLKLKMEQSQEILKDSETMLNICSHLMPANNKNVSQKDVRECLDLISSETNKKQIYNKLSQTLGSCHIPTLWSLLLENQSQDMETLIKLGKEEVSEFKNTVGEDIDIGLAKACGEHIKLVSMQLLETAKTSQNEKILLDYIEKIELSEPNVNEWLEFVLEVRMFEVEQNLLEKEANEILNSIHDQERSEFELAELSSRLENLSLQKQKLIEEVQKSLGFLKGIRYLTSESREEQLVHLQTIAILHSNSQEAHFYQWQNVDLSLELEIFFKDFDLEALRQMTIKKQVIEQRHFKHSFNQAWIHLSGKVSYKLPNKFFMFKIPLQYLLECYKALHINALLKRTTNSKPIELPFDYQQWDTLDSENIIKASMELLHRVNLTCKKSNEHVNEFEHMFDFWNHQPIENTFSVLDEITVDGATLKEWQKRYSVLMYMFKKSSNVSLSFQPYSFADR